VDKSLRRLIDAVATTRLCYGEPVRQGDRTVIPVARVRASGGWGTGWGPRAGKEGRPGGSGGGGNVDALPAGFIEVGPEGAHFHEIRDPDRTQRLLKAGAGALVTAFGAVAGARRLQQGRRRPAGLLGHGR
jgi:uncharacterized spore protein YtfJ